MQAVCLRGLQNICAMVSGANSHSVIVVSFGSYPYHSKRKPSLVERQNECVHFFMSTQNWHKTRVLTYRWDNKHMVNKQRKNLPFIFVLLSLFWQKDKSMSLLAQITTELYVATSFCTYYVYVSWNGSGDIYLSFIM